MVKDDCDMFSVVLTRHSSLPAFGFNLSESDDGQVFVGLIRENGILDRYNQDAEVDGRERVMNGDILMAVNGVTGAGMLQVLKEYEVCEMYFHRAVIQDEII